MEMEIDRYFVIFDCKPNGSNNLIFGGALVLSKVLDSNMTVANYDLRRNYKEIHSMLNNRMWMVHDRVNCTRLTYGCKNIGKPPPIPKSIIDTSLFTSSKTKLGRAAVMFGLGMQKHGFNWDYKANLSAISACAEIMSNLDVPVKTLNGTVHPMIYYLMQYNDQMKDEVRARYFNEAEYPSFDKIDDLPIMLLVDDVLKNRKRKLKELNYELEKQKEDASKDLVYYRYEDFDDDDQLKEPETRKEDDDDDVEDEDSDNYEEFARTRGIKDESKDYKYEGIDDDDKLKEHETREEDDDEDESKDLVYYKYEDIDDDDNLKEHETRKDDDDDDVEDEDSDDCEECARTRGVGVGGGGGGDKGPRPG